MNVPGLPLKQGLYDPQHEKDSCGVGFVVDIKGQRSHQIVQQGLQVLERLTHRGAQGCDPCTGDGAGILLQVPHEFFKRVVKDSGIKLPGAGEYGVGMVFLPPDADARAQCETVFARVIKDEGAKLLGWRDVPVKSDAIGPVARSTEPFMRQVFIARGIFTEDEFERRLYVIRKSVERAVRESAIEGREYFYIPSLSSSTIVYKGLLLPHQIPQYYQDLTDSSLTSALALVHSRFSTNTFPTWPLAHPYRYICHNGEINTLKGNVNWMRARQGRLNSELFGEDMTKLFPIVYESQSDSASLDNALEFLVLGGRSLPHAMMMLIPEPWVANPQMDLDRRGFYEYHAAMQEPWDGPAAVCFTDGKLIGATLDRNGLRPCRYQVTTDGLVVLASEAGVLPMDPQKIRQKGRLMPGRMFLVDTVQGRIIDDEEVKADIVRRKPYRSWVTEHRISLDELPEPINVPQPDHPTIRQRQQAFGYTVEELKMVITPMVVDGQEAISSMGTDTPLAVLSDRPQLLFKYFKQLFAQVTNPPIDPIREELVMSLTTSIGPKPNLMDENPESCRRIRVKQPILTNADLQKIRELADPHFKSKTLKMLFRVAEGPEGLGAAVDDLCKQASQAIREGYKFLILSDRGVNEDYAPIPSLLGVAAVHHHLVRECTRTEVGLTVETGEPRDVHHFACLIGYGAGTVNPYLVFESLVDLERDGYLPEGLDAQTAEGKYIKAINKGLLKIFSKMGISTVQSYCGAQIFEAIGLNRELIDRYFTGTPSRVEGISIREIGEESLRRHRVAYEPVPIRQLDFGGEIHYRIQGEHHNWNPDTIYKLQHATRNNDPKTFAEFSQLVNDESKRRSNLRGLLDFKYLPEPIPLEEVEPAREIVKRFTTGAMSFGSISREAHETLAVAMNRLGAKSNTGEGGEDPERFTPLPNGDSRNSYIKQVASARFGVTSHYLVNAKELQIKMAQGAKPGEGGQLPGHKVDENIARLRYSTPGVQLISPPPHHDIYSIEDLAQLIFDLKNANADAAVSVKLVSEVGVGTVAAGVAKAHADKVLISGDSGGTGASPLSSIKYAGIPWELGLAETHQTLVLNDLRGRIRVETDGQMKTGRDVAIAALLGAEEYGFATAPLIVEGCIMMRKCHLNTCPVGIATQDPVLRKKFTGQPDHVVNFFFFVAEELRQIMAKLGFRTVNEMVGRVDKLKVQKAVDHWKAKGLDLAPLLAMPDVGPDVARYCVQKQDHGIADILDRTLIERCAPAIERGEKVSLELPIRNLNRTAGTMLSSRIAKKYGLEGLPADTITIKFNGSAGQSFGAFLSRGITLILEGESNDYIGKGLSGGKIIVFPPKQSLFTPEETILVGNTSLYGGTQGEAYFYGMAGERFAVRNSGVRAVVEGTGDHGCEYMTGGVVVVLGRTGRNFAAGMSGGVAFVLNELDKFQSRCNLGMVELEQVASEDDKKLLHDMITSHFLYTGSRNAKRILDAWEVMLPKFVKVMPIDYKRVLAERKAAAAKSAK
ncbi:MAG: Ferredoxin-dependent glutamate synthase 1 [Nitrospirae bacterium]|nr:MAG: glutamate synthase subunit alpha [Nitrospira sp. OLB3]MBV6470705.1 Ferredoxin-dependent glutamate synthase 1 [Nitrospirota bacterium]MCE7964879.1 glutamate synthase large subunit [Nitrospira sp. NTP2]MCK6492321.1 glutamate synthase large subunit [Nitrospira sp.]MEB2338044.1 glutamate synthase large subunit [Nitrospirales bacterium]